MEKVQRPLRSIFLLSQLFNVYVEYTRSSETSRVGGDEAVSCEACVSLTIGKSNFKPEGKRLVLSQENERPDAACKRLKRPDSHA